MNIIICGLPGSGKTTTYNLIKETSTDIVDIGTSIDSLISHFNEKSRILVLDCPVILCYQRVRHPSARFEEFIKNYNIEQQVKLLKYMTELPNCSIIKNDQTLDHLRLQIKKFLKK